ncbi:MAG: PaaI family thioesterase [Saprospiraceae bacterium]|nr:PaaI family thioesterase [Saprospiraceae bacterium]
MSKIWKKKFTLEGLNAMCENGLSDHLEITYVEVGDDYLIATMPVKEFHKQPLGLVHGGATATLAESVASVASLLAAEEEKQSAVGVELNINHLRSAKSGVLTAKCAPVKLGRNIHVWNIEIFDDEGRQISVSRLTTMVK